MTYFVVIMCAIGISAGQILFKLCSSDVVKSKANISATAVFTFACAILIYGFTSIAWVWVLQKIELNKAYPFMALAFVLVPLASHYLFSDELSYQYVVGVVLVVMGIIVLTTG